MAVMPGTVFSQDWSDNFEGYSVGSFPSEDPAPGDPWDTWSSDPVDAAGEYGMISTDQAFSGSNSLMIQDTDDIIVQLSQVSSGVWAIKVNYYIPASAQGTVYFILMNEFTPACTGACNWALQLEMRCADDTEKLVVDGVERDLVLDDWAQLEVLFDLNSNVRDIYYAGEMVTQGITYVGNDTSIALAAIDLYAAGGSGPAYLDDISVAQVPAPFRATQQFNDIALDWGLPVEASKTPLDISAAFNADVVFAPGEDINDQTAFDQSAAVLIQDEFDGTDTANANANGLPENGLVGQFQLGAYDADNTLQFRSGGDLSDVTIDLADGQYGSLLYCTGAGNGGVTVPVTVNYGDGSSEEAQMIARDWYWGADQGLSIAIDSMDRISLAGAFEDSNNPALFQGAIALDSTKTLDSITIRPGDGPVNQNGDPVNWAAGGDGVVFNLLAVTAVEHVSYELTREGAASATTNVTLNDVNSYFDEAVPDDLLTYTLVPTVGGIELEAQTATILWQDAVLTAGGRVGSWLVLGHFPNPGGSNPGVAAQAADFLADGISTEADILPTEGLEMALDPDVDMTCGTHADCNFWFRADRADGYVDFNGIYGDVDDVMTYMAVYLVNKTGSTLPVEMRCGSDDGIAIVLDGVHVHNNSVPRGHGFDSDSFLTLLTPGEHRVLAKVFEGGGGHGASLGFFDPITGEPLQYPDIELNIEPLEMVEVPEDPGIAISAIEVDGGFEVSFTVADEADVVEFKIYRHTDLGLAEVGTVTADGSGQYSAVDEGLTDEMVVADWIVSAIFTDGTEVPSVAFRARLTGVDDSGNIVEWLMLAQYTQSNGSNPSHDLMAADYLTEGEGGLTEADIIPVAGLQMNTDYNVAESTGCNIGTAGAPYTCPPTWVALHNIVTVNYNTIFGEVDNLMSYQVTYLTNTTDEALRAIVHYQTDDGAIVLIDNAVWSERLSGCCNEYTDPIMIAPGEHRFMIKTFEGGGGFNTRVWITDENGTPFPQGTITCSTIPTITEMPPAPVLVTRMLPDYIIETATEVQVTLSISSGNSTELTMYEEIPAEYGDPFDITSGGVWDAENRLIVWTGITETVSYKVTPVDGAPLPVGLIEDPTAGLGSILGGAVPAIAQDLGDGWATTFIGDTNGELGEVLEFTEADGLYSTQISAGGSDIWGTQDEFQFLWKEFSVEGYVEISGRLDVFQQGVNNWSKAGLMFRNNVSRGSSGVWGVVRSQEYNGYMQWRDGQNASAARDGNVNLTGLGLPCWFLAVYVNGQVTVRYALDDIATSVDEVTWQYEETHNLVTDGASRILGGICVTSHNNTALVNAEFSNIDVYTSSAPTLDNFAVAENGDGNVELTWDLAGVGQFDSIIVERAVLPFDFEWTELETLAGDATSFVDSTAGLLTGQYRITASFDTGGVAGVLSTSFVVDYKSSSLPADTLVFQDGSFPGTDYTGCQDSHITYNNITNNMGGHDMIEEGDWNGGHGDHKEALIQFDIGEIPTGKEVKSAQLYLFFDNCRSGQYIEHTSFAHPILKEWNEGAGTGVDGVAAITGEVTWEAAIYNVETPADSIYWQDWGELTLACADIDRNGGAYGPEDIETRDVPSTPYGASQYVWVEWDMTGIVQDWAGGLPNYGVKITQTPPDVYDPCYDFVAGGYDFRSSNHAAVATRPMLVIQLGEITGVGRFIGDANCDDGVNIADAVATLSYLFSGGAACCLTNMDANGDGGVNIADAVAVLSYLFSGGDLIMPGGGAIEEAGCGIYDPALISDDVMPCDTPCPYAK